MTQYESLAKLISATSITIKITISKLIFILNV